MHENASQPTPTKKEAREERREERREAQQRALKSGRMRKTLLRASAAAIVAAALGAGIWSVASRPPTPEGDIISQKGLHWHSTLGITIDGVEQKIPANIGIGAMHNPIHTHDDAGTIHMEMQGRVTKDDIRLGKLFQVWGKPFSSTCILDVCNGPNGTLRMVVNGSASAEFDSYMMQDADKIELIYE